MMKASQTESPGHPLRTALHLRERRADIRKRARDADEDSDIKLFVLSYTAFFVCFYTFLI